MNLRTTCACWPLLLFMLVAASCKKNETKTAPSPNPSSSSHCNCENEIAFPGTKGETISLKNKDNQEMATLVKKGDKYILGGDMILTEEQVNIIRTKIANPLIPIPKGTGRKPQEEKSNTGAKQSNNRKIPDWAPNNELYRTAISNTTNYWTNRTVYYTISAAVPNQQRITDAITHWQNNTNINFVPRTTQNNYVEFVNMDDHCYSDLGMIGGRQILNVGNGCSTGNVIHEIGHTLGFLHEQTRADRDNFIIVYTNNIQPGALSQFTKYTETYGQWSAFQTDTYDFGSIMTYGSFDFRIGNQPTMTRLDGTFFFGQRDGLSAGDIATYNLMYNPTRFGRVEYENYNYNWYSNSYFYTDADVYIRFYSDAACTIPANPVFRAIFTENVLNDGVSYSYIGEIPTTTNSYSLGKQQLEYYSEDSGGNGHSSGVSIQLESYVGYTVMSPYTHP